jgi:hypothetical protein
MWSLTIKLYRPEEAFSSGETLGALYSRTEKMNDRKSNNDTLIITKSLKDVMVFYEFIGDRYDVIAPHSETYIYRDLSKVFICQAKIIIIYDFDL